VNLTPFEYKRKVGDSWRKVRVFESLEDMREYYCSWFSKNLAADDPFKKVVMDTIDDAIAGKIKAKPEEIMRIAMVNYATLYGSQNVTKRKVIRTRKI
jgi:hypothetical protein